MSDIYPRINCTEEELKTLRAWSNSGRQEKRLVDRARIILLSAEGISDMEITRRLKTRPNTVGKWRKRYSEQGVAGLYDAPRSGKPFMYEASETRREILETLESPVPKGQATWDGKSVAEKLGISKHKVWRVLRKEGISLQRQRSWCVSTDPEFATKAADIVGLYLNPPQKALVLSVDEKPSIQALERATGYIHTSSKKLVRGLKSTYKRHGTLNLFAALEVATGQIHSRITELKRRVEFLEFMDAVVADYPNSEEIHVIMDNYCIHKKCDVWLKAHPNVHFHYTPTSASWLNMVEIWFGILSRKALRGASFTSCEELATAIGDFVEVYNEKTEPFTWRKREVKGSQLKNTIANLRN
jgi:transposase